MQSDAKTLYKLTAQRTGGDEQLYKDIGNFVFAKLYSYMRRPPTLIIRLAGVGSWFLRKKRIEIVMNEYPIDYSKTFNDNFKPHLGFLEKENKQEIFELFTARIREYEEFLKMKNETRQERNKTGVLLEPRDWED